MRKIRQNEEKEWWGWGALNKVVREGFFGKEIDLNTNLKK